MKSTYRKKYLSEIASRTVMLHALTQREIADKINMHPSTLNRAIHGSPVNRDDDRWSTLSAILELPQRRLFE